MVPTKLSMMTTSYLPRWYGTDWDSSSALPTLAQWQMGGNTYFQNDCVTNVFILRLMILVITGSTPTEKLDRHKYLVRQGYWSYIEGAQETALNLINPQLPHMARRGQQGNNVLFGNMCARSHVQLYSRCEGSRGGMGKLEEGFPGSNQSQETSTSNKT